MHYMTCAQSDQSSLSDLRTLGAHIEDSDKAV